MRRVCQTLFLVLAAGVIAQAFWQYGQSPERVATHFDLSGRPNGWMSRGGALGFQVGLVLFETTFLQGIVLLMPRLPANLINIPNRNYWLSPERRDATLAWLGTLVLIIGCGLMTFWLWLSDRVYQANLSGGHLTLRPALVLTVALVAVASVAAVVVRQFWRPATRA